MISPCSPATLYLGSRCECALALTSTEADPDVGCQRGKPTFTFRVAVGPRRGVDSNHSLPPVRVGSLGRIARLLTVVCILQAMALSWVKIEIGGVVGEVTALVGKTDDLRARAWPGHGRHGAGQCRAPAGLAHGFETTPTSAANGWARRRPSTLRPPQHGQSKRCDQLDDPVHAVLQPLVRQFRGAPVQLVRPPLDIG